MEAAKIGPDLRLLRTKQLNWPIRSIRVFKAILVKVIQLTLTLKMTTAQVVESSVTVNNSPIQDYVHPDNNSKPTYYTNLQLLCLCDWLTSDHSLYVLFAHMVTFWTEQPTEGESIINITMVEPQVISNYKCIQLIQIISLMKSLAYT